MKLSDIKYDVFQLTTYCTGIHLFVKRYQAKWCFVYFYVSVLFSGNVSVTLLPFPASHRNVKFYLTFLTTLRWGSLQAFHKDQDGIFRCVLLLKKAIFAVKCCSFLFYCEVLLFSLRRSGCSECEFWWWPKGTNVDEKAEPHHCELGRQGAPALTWKAAAIQSGLGQRDINEPREMPKTDEMDL